MTRIGLLSDTHGVLDPRLETYFSACDEIWHAGDIGTTAVLEELESWGKVTRCVFGNIDGHEIRRATKEDLWFKIEGVEVFMTHIGGYPGRYQKRIRSIFHDHAPDLFVCGHSHILKIIYDKKYQLLHMNPGACGKQGFQKVRTAIRFGVDGEGFKDVEVIELGEK